MVIPCLNIGVLCSEVEQGAGKPSSDHSTGAMSSEKAEAPTAEVTRPDDDQLQLWADKVMADCIKDVVSEVTPGDVAAQSRPVAPAVAPEPEDVQVNIHTLVFVQEHSVRWTGNYNGLHAEELLGLYQKACYRRRTLMSRRWLRAPGGLWAVMAGMPQQL